MRRTRSRTSIYEYTPWIIKGGREGLRAKRSKSGAVSFEVIAMEGTDAPLQ